MRKVIGNQATGEKWRAKNGSAAEGARARLVPPAPLCPGDLLRGPVDRAPSEKTCAIK